MPTRRSERGATVPAPADAARAIGGLHGRMARQPVRTTFRLTAEGHEALAWMADRYGVTLKDAVAGVVRAVDELRSQPATFNDWVRSSERLAMDRGQRKTQVIPRETMIALRDLSQATGLPRDRVLEGGIRLVREATAAGERALRQQHEKALRLMRGLGERLDDAQEKLTASLERTDPVLYRFGRIASAMHQLTRDLENELATGTPVDPEGI